MNENLKLTRHKSDICVIGGGLAGMIAAIAAARQGASVVLMHDRPVLGGNCSSEIRMVIRGAYGDYNREMGILNEIEFENIYRNPSLNYSLWDSVLYGKVMDEKNITLLLNCSCIDAIIESGRITEITGWQLNTYTRHKVNANMYIDCSGDSILSTLTGAEFRYGREAANEFNESLGQRKADAFTMGMSCLIEARELVEPVQFLAPKWAYTYKDESFVFNPYIGDFSNKREHVLGVDNSNFWWIELGGTEDAIHDTDHVRNELLKTSMGIWDHIKNYCVQDAGNWELEWMGFLPGKRESRRYVGDHILTENDIVGNVQFDDVVAYGGWPLDDHDPRGFLNQGQNSIESKYISVPTPYCIPYRSLYSKNISNLLFAGRNISATHVALSSTRVMATCSVIGQAAGNAAALCVQKSCSPRELYHKHILELQNRLLEQHCLLPGHRRSVPEVTKKATMNLSFEDIGILQNGKERPYPEEERNFVALPKGSRIDFNFHESTQVNVLRMVFDPDYSRESISSVRRLKKFAQLVHRSLDFEPLHMPTSLVRWFVVYADDLLIHEEKENHKTLVSIPIRNNVRKISVHFYDTWGMDMIHVFSCDVQ